MLDSGRRPAAFERLAQIVRRHRWKVVAGWVIALIGMVVLSVVAGEELATRFTIPGTESQKAIDLLEERFPQRAGGQARIVFQSDATLDDAAVRQRIEAIVEEAGALPDVSGVTSPYVADANISDDRRTGFAVVQYSMQADVLPASTVESLTGLVDRVNGVNGVDGLTVEVGGEVVAVSERGALGSAELIGLAAAAVILVVVFGSFVAMGIPIITALVSLGGTLALLGVAARLFDITEFTPSFVAMIGIGVGIDYALLVVTRFREGLHSGCTVEEAIATAMNTSGRSVLFAGAVVVIALLGLTVIGIPFIAGIGVAGAIVVSLSVIAALTLLPAMLSILGHRVDSLAVSWLHTRETDHHTTIWYRLSLAIQRRPVWFALGSVGVLAVLALPVLDMETGFTDAGNNPTSLHSRRAYDLLKNGFGPGFNGPLLVVVDTQGGGDSEAIAKLSEAIAAAPNVQGVSDPVFNPDDDTAILTIFPGSSPQSSRTNDLVGRLRSEVIPAAVDGTGMDALVAGQTAAIVDVSDRISSRTPLFFAAVIGVSFILLMSVFRSVLVPLKAALMNLLSIGAAYGVIVAVFQWGWFAGPLGIDTQGPIEIFLPMMMFAILFGLSMDYEVFLVSRIREEYVAGADNSSAVALGLSSTARVISAAALIMIAVFSSFILGDERVIKEFGLGLAAAIFVDATIVRLMLVPATMELLGRANWWLPGWLDRLLPHIAVERPQEPVRGGAPAAGQ